MSDGGINGIRTMSEAAIRDGIEIRTANCVASVSRRAYCAGSATIGPMIALAYRAARAADTEPIKGPSLAGMTA